VVKAVRLGREGGRTAVVVSAREGGDEEELGGGERRGQEAMHKT
jgi:hypothetical protein